MKNPATSVPSAMLIVTVSLLLCIGSSADAAAVAKKDAAAPNDGRIRTSEDLVTAVMSDCASLMCVKNKVLSYLDSLLGLSDDDARNFKRNNIDRVIFQRMARLVKTHQFSASLPGGTEVTYHPVSGLDIDIPARPDDDEFTSQARGILKKKLLLPVLLLLKLKLKALMPIFVALIGLKSLKALILSKLAILLVVGFLVYTFFIKGGMAMPMMMTPTEPPSTAYGSPMSPSPPMSSYEPGWEPSAGGSMSSGPYSRIWSSSGSSSSSSSDSSPPSSAHNIAYSAYYPVSLTSTSSPSY